MREGQERKIGKFENRGDEIRVWARGLLPHVGAEGGLPTKLWNVEVSVSCTTSPPAPFLPEPLSSKKPFCLTDDARPEGGRVLPKMRRGSEEASDGRSLFEELSDREGAYAAAASEAA